MINMKSRYNAEYFAVMLGLFCLLTCVVGWQSDSDRIQLKDIKVITLYHGRMVNARRSSPIPQMKCLGGSAGCSSFTPQVVQCYNRGTDGYDVQWECQTDMDNAYRFGQVEVSCEGYEYPDDPYILRGSCGLEYTLDLTKEGHAQKNHGSNQHSYYGEDSNTYTKANRKESHWLGNLITLAIICIIIYAIYVTCLSSSGQRGQGYTSPPPDGNRARGYGSAPPPPGFRDEYMPGGGCSSTYDSTHTAGTGQTGATGGGFWSGAATGGIMGYLFGSRNNTGHYGGYQRPYGSTWGGGSSFGGGRSMFGSGTTGGATYRPTSTGTRTASGFGGTKRR